MANIGTTFTKSGKKAVLCGSGELGKEVAIELQRYGVEVVALDKYPDAPAMPARNERGGRGRDRDNRGGRGGRNFGGNRGGGGPMGGPMGGGPMMGGGFRR